MTGDSGLPGAAGFIGPVGQQGATGETGFTGLKGGQGQEGFPGDTGATGFSGLFSSSIVCMSMCFRAYPREYKGIYTHKIENFQHEFNNCGRICF